MLGIMQGLTEFLPVSSSGHLVLAQVLLGLKEPEVFFDLVLHLGTLTAVIVYYRTEFFGMLKELRQLLSPDRLKVSFRTRPLFRLGVLIVIASIPTALIGFFFKDFFTSLFTSLLAVGVNLLITASLLVIAYFRKKVTVKSELEFPVWIALTIGIIQGLAIAPGLSRSGATIALAIILGMESSLAARFSFLLSIPAIIGATLLKIPEASASAFPKAALFGGFLSASIIGFLSLILLALVLKKDRFFIFVPWCVVAGTVALFLHFHLQG
jgi:undecaprenyl-diphosphatase